MSLAVNHALGGFAKASIGPEDDWLFRWRGFVTNDLGIIDSKPCFTEWGAHRWSQRRCKRFNRWLGG